MNTEQFRLLQENDLATDMICALANLVEGKKIRHQNRSYKALHRRGLANENFQITEDGSTLYEQYCSIGQSIPEYLREVEERVRVQRKAENAFEGEYVDFLQGLDVNLEALGAIDRQDSDLRVVIESWPKLPLEFRMLIADAAKRVANQGAARSQDEPQ